MVIIKTKKINNNSKTITIIKPITIIKITTTK